MSKTLVNLALGRESQPNDSIANPWPIVETVDGASLDANSIAVVCALRSRLNRNPDSLVLAHLVHAVIRPLRSKLALSAPIRYLSSTVNQVMIET